MATKQITLPVTGMTCAMCVRNVERSLQKAEGVAEVSVNLATEKANVQYDSDKLAASDLNIATKSSGPATASPAPTIDLPITGMTCAMCQKNVARALNKTEGVISASVNLASEKASVAYLPGVARRRDLVDAVEHAGYGVIDTAAADAPEDAEAAARQAEIDRQTRLVKIGAAFTVPLTLLSMTRHFMHQIPVLMDNFAFLAGDIWLFIFAALATPVVLLLGRQYLSGALKSLRNGSANMDVLVSLGAFAAYLYGIIVLLGIAFGFSDLVGKSDYFESAAVILTLITLGKLLEARAKGRTSAAIKKLMGLAPKTAILLSDGRQKVDPHRRSRARRSAAGQTRPAHPGGRNRRRRQFRSRRIHAHRREPAGRQSRRRRGLRRRHQPAGPPRHRSAARRPRHRPGPDHPPGGKRPGQQGAHPGRGRSRGLGLLRASRHLPGRRDAHRLAHRLAAPASPRPSST